MRMDEGIHIHLFNMDKYVDTLDDTLIIFRPETKTHIEFVSIPSQLPGGNPDIQYCIVELGGYGGMKTHKWLVIKMEKRENVATEIFDSVTEAITYVETMTSKIVKFRREG